MPKATGFQFDSETGNVKMNSGDTGSYWVHATRGNGESWTENSRMLYTVTSAQGDIMMQRIYRLDNQWGEGDGYVLIEFHNDDTDTWDGGDYQMERRYDVNPIWNGEAPAARCVNALAENTPQMVEGVPVRTVFQGKLHIDGVYGRI